MIAAIQSGTRAIGSPWNLIGRFTILLLAAKVMGSYDIALDTYDNYNTQFLHTIPSPNERRNCQEKKKERKP